MDNKKSKIEEPYTPDNTPTPPQIIDPNKQNEEQELQSKRTADGDSGRKNQRPVASEKKEKLLNEDADINDETTI